MLGPARRSSSSRHPGSSVEPGSVRLGPLPEAQHILGCIHVMEAVGLEIGCFDYDEPGEGRQQRSLPLLEVFAERVARPHPVGGRKRLRTAIDERHERVGVGLPPEALHQIRHGPTVDMREIAGQHDRYLHTRMWGYRHSVEATDQPTEGPLARPGVGQSRDSRCRPSDDDDRSGARRFEAVERPVEQTAALDLERCLIGAHPAR